MLVQEPEPDVFPSLSSSSPMAQVVKNPPANAGGAGLIPGSGRSPGEGNCNPLQYSCLENPMDKGAWQATVHGVAKELDGTERLKQHIRAKEIKLKKW